MKFIRRHIPVIAFGGAAIAILVALYVFIPKGSQVGNVNGVVGSGSSIDFPTEPITLTYWRTADGITPFADILRDYKTLHPNVTIKLSNVSTAEYDKKLTEAVAAGKAPDIYAINSDWMERYSSSYAAAPDSVFTAEEYRTTFLPVVSDSLIKGDQVVGASYGVSTLGLFYNPALLAKAGIKDPPKTWQQFLEYSKKLTVMTGPTITMSGAAIGGTNVDNYTAIVSILMMQNGASMTDNPVSRATFASPDPSGYPPGAKALSFYASFAKAGSANQSWDPKASNSLEAFEQGKTAMLIDYAYQAPVIDATTPELNYKMTRLPQVNTAEPTNYADYWVELVSNKSKHSEVAWDFLRFASSKVQMNRYNIATYRPASRKDLVKDQQTDMYLGPFAQQSASAQTWRKGNNYNADGIFSDMIEAVLAGGSAQAAVDTGSARVTQEIVRSK